MSKGNTGGAGGGLRRLRLVAGFSLRDLADVAGISHAAIARAETTGQATPRVIDALSAVLGDEVRDVIGLARPRGTQAGTNPVVAARHERGWSRRKAARYVGVSDRVLARVEAGERVRPSNAKRIALAYGLDVATVIDLADDANGAVA